MKNTAKEITEIFIIVLGAIALVAVLVLLFAIPVWLLWNWLMPELFGLKTITIWQAIGINLLSTFLFRIFGGSSKK